MNKGQKFVGLLMNSRSQAHAFHLTTNSFAEHKALQAYYEGIVPLLDAYAEAYMGKYGRFRKVILGRKTIAKNPKLYFRTLLKTIQSMRLPRDTYLKNIQDEITALIRSTLYMLSLK
jgi:hypothetical protein